MNPRIAGWYSPSTGRFWTDTEVQIAVNGGGSIPEDAIPLTYAADTRQLLRQLEVVRKEVQDLTCAIESAQEEMKKLQDDFK